MAVADRTGLPRAVHTAAAMPHEVPLVPDMLVQLFTTKIPERLMGNKADDSDQPLFMGSAPPAAKRGTFGLSDLLDASCENCDHLLETCRETGGVVMSQKLTQLLEEMTPQERAEVETFAAFIIVRRHLQQPQLLTDDTSVQELTELVAAAGGFDWLNAEEENIYSLTDGEAVQWPNPS